MKYARKNKIIFVLAIVLCITFLGNIIISFAETSSKELQQQQQQNEKEIEDTKDEQEKIKKEMTSIQKEVDALNTKISGYQDDIYALADDIEDTEDNIKKTEENIEKTQKELEKKEKLLEDRLVASYKAGETTYLDVLLSSESLTSFLSSYYMIQTLADNDTKLIKQVQETKEALKESKKALEEAKTKLEKSKKILETKKSELSVVRNQKNKKVTQLSAEERDLEKKIEQMQAEDSRIRAAIKKAKAREKARAEAERRKQLANGSSGSSAPTSPSKGGFIYPVPSAYATVTTGLYYSKGGYHGAVDFGSHGINGQPVYAAKSGIVILTARLTYSYGNYVLIDHEDGTYSLYAHGQAGSICVSEGQSVSRGQQIMRVGSTGNSSGPHLHFEIRLSPGGYSNRVNPMNYL